MHVMSTTYVLGFGEIDQTQGAVVGGKGANLGELSGSRVFACAGRLLRDDRGISSVRAQVPSVDQLLERLTRTEAG